MTAPLCLSRRGGESDFRHKPAVWPTTVLTFLFARGTISTVVISTLDAKDGGRIDGDGGDHGVAAADAGGVSHHAGLGRRGMPRLWHHAGGRSDEIGRAS